VPSKSICNYQQSAGFSLSPSFSSVEGAANLTIRESRKQRKIDLDPTQTLITDYFNILDEIEILAKENERLSRLVSQCGINPYSIGGDHEILSLMANSGKH